MTNKLPQIDPHQLYLKALEQIRDLNDQNIQMDEMITLLVQQRDEAIKERDEVKFELKNLLGATESAAFQGEVVNEETEETSP